MKDCMPEAYNELVENCEILEAHYKDMMVKVLPQNGKISPMIQYIMFLLAFLSSLSDDPE